jgi:hypothetical protein
VFNRGAVQLTQHMHGISARDGSQVAISPTIAYWRASVR